MDISAVALIVLLFLGTGIIWLSNKKGSFIWHWKNRFLGEMGAEAKGPTDLQISQSVSHSKTVKQSASGRNIKQDVTHSEDIEQTADGSPN